MIDKIQKSRQEQEEEFKQIMHYADSNCKYCYGTGKEYWIIALDQYKVCECVMKNIRVLRERGMN